MHKYMIYEYYAVVKKLDFYEIWNDFQDILSEEIKVQKDICSRLLAAFFFFLVEK